MTSLSIFTNEISDLEAQITAFQARLTELQQADFVAQGALQALTGALAEFEKLGALPKFKSAVLSLLGGSPSPDGEPKFENFVTEVAPKQLTIESAIESAIADSDDTRWNPEQFDLHPVETDGQAIIPGLEPGDPNEPSDPEEELEQPVAVSTVEVAAEAEQMTPTLAYQKKHDGEIVCGYLGTTTQKLAKEWAQQIELWGCRTQVRKAKRVTSEGVAWEIKIWNISSDRLTKLATYHSQPFQTVAAASSVGKEPKKSSAPTEATTSLENSETPNAAIAAVPNEKQNDWQPKVGDKVRIAEMIGEYQIATVGSIYVTARRTTDQTLITQILPTECTPVLKDEPEITFGFRQTGDSISPDYEVFVGSERLGKVWEHLTKPGCWNHSLNRNPALSWRTREDAAFSLQLAFENERDLHERTNAQLRKRYGLAG